MSLTFPSNPAVDATYTASGSTWIWTGTAWDLVRQAAGPSGPSGPTGPAAAFSIVQTTPPSSPQPGQAWYNSADGLTYIYYDSSWIEFGNSLAGPTGPSGPSGATGATGPSGPSGPSGAGGGSWSVIGTYNSTSGFFSSFTGLAGGYKELILEWSGLACTTANGILGNALIAKVNGDNNNYTGGGSWVFGGSAGSSVYLNPPSPITTFVYGSGKFHVRAADSTGTKYWEMISSGLGQSSLYGSTQAMITVRGAGTYTGTSAINSINFQVVNENWTSGTWTLWGLA
jgi:hypothetical protein